MTRKKPSASTVLQLARIKELVVIAMFSDDELMDCLVLKGGNALDLVHRISVRASLDVDFSMEGDFAPERFGEIRDRIERALASTFGDEGFVAFDVTLKGKPPRITIDMADFWGGYLAEFKLVDKTKYDMFAPDTNMLRRNALMLGPSSRLMIEISRHEYIEGKEVQYLDGHRIFVYSAEMIVGEKLRAICQQMPEYGPIIKRSRKGSARARDFVDIHTLVTDREMNLESEANRRLVGAIFAAKRVPMSLIDRIEAYREFHRPDFAAVQATVKAGVRLESFDFYFDFVLDLAKRLKPLRNV